MNDLDNFFVTEVFDGGVEVDEIETAAGTVVIPTASQKREDGNRKPIDAGYVLGWSEWPAEHPEQKMRRRGMVEAPVGGTAAFWVLPDEQREGEGMFVVVRGITAASTKEAHRIVGGPGDFRSLDRWQRPRTLLPRAWQRTYTGEFQTYDQLHADRDCVGFHGRNDEPGPPRVVEDCYVFDGALHPMSNRPSHRGGEVVPVCFRCMREHLPA